LQAGEQIENAIRAGKNGYRNLNEMLKSILDD